ncbi:arginine--tRNA ligase [Candidatus Dojkabacteria bacterium]|uniref:Arginine--tRNA ligase n=1 Tax=Candidatus Dojkabacteria bacterium TaxID=2099670 RepID=A0A3M0Z3D4_9BACT|nr:MAG: arginine--tRNA ligase [Candidatus Dojkabacteria bacterium]
MVAKNFKEIIKQTLISALTKSFPNLTNSGFDNLNDFQLVEISSDLSKGDFTSNIAFTLSKKFKMSPNQVAMQIVNELNKNQFFIDQKGGGSDPKLDFRAEFAPPGFINFFVGDSAFYYAIREALDKKENYGKSLNPKYCSYDQGKLISKKILIEHTSPNPNKEMHIGHLKNNVTGISISNLIRMQGGLVFNDMVNNNRGIAIAKLMWGYLKFARIEESTPTDLNYWFEHQDKWHTPETKRMFPGKFIDELYVLGANDCKENKDSEKIVKQLVVDWEAENPKNHALWELTQKWVWEGYKAVLERINGWQFDHVWNESDHYKMGKELVKKGLEMQIFSTTAEGAVITSLKKFALTDTVVLKSDGTSLYITQDIALTKLKKEKFNSDIMMWVIGPEQSLQMKQMFAVCSQLGIGKYSDFIHIPYGFILVKKPDGTIGKASSREGSYHVMDLLDEMKSKIYSYIKPEFTDKEKEEIAEKLAIASVKYSLLKVARNQDLVFDKDVSISTEGDSAPYILYSLVRAKALLKGQPDDLFTSEVKEEQINDQEKELTWQIAKFPDVVTAATNALNPALICNFCYELANKFNKFYSNCPILNAENENKKILRLQITKAFEINLQNALKILNIEWVDKM